MSCYSCGLSFGLFRKELGCKNCGYVFCKDCVSKKTSVPKLNNEKHKVCLKCYKILTGQIKPTEDKTARYSPPEALRKRLAKLEEKSSSHNQGPQTSTKTSQPIITKGMTKEDIAIATRLQRLKDDRKRDEVPVSTDKQMRERLDKLKKDTNSTPPPSEQDMACRLAKLKGHDVTNVQKPHVFIAPRRAECEQVEDLLQEICDEVEIDSHHIDPASDVQNRLDKLHDNQPADYQNNLNSPSSKDQFVYTKNIPHIEDNYKSVSGEDVDWSEMNQLISQAANEMDLDAKKAIDGLKQDRKLWDRLNKIKDKKKENKDIVTENNDPETASSINEEIEETASSINDEIEETKESNETEEEACKNIIKQLLEESRLEDEMEEEEMTGKKMRSAPSVPMATSSSINKKIESSDAEFTPDEDELPYCCICNNDASLRCMGCDGDLYCKRCYKEGHDREDYADHPTRPYKPPKSQK